MLERAEAPASGFDIGYTKKVLAARLGMRPETLSRAFAKLEREELIRISGSHIEIIDRAGLEAMV